MILCISAIPLSNLSHTHTLKAIIPSALSSSYSDELILHKRPYHCAITNTKPKLPYMSRHYPLRSTQSSRLTLY